MQKIKNLITATFSPLVDGVFALIVFRLFFDKYIVSFMFVAMVGCSEPCHVTCEQC